MLSLPLSCVYFTVTWEFKESVLDQNICFGFRAVPDCSERDKEERISIEDARPRGH